MNDPGERARDLGLSREHLQTILSDALAFLKAQLQPLIDEKIADLKYRQRSSFSPVTLRPDEVAVFAVHSCQIVREAAGRLARVLGEAVGRRQGFRTSERESIEEIIEDFVKENTSPEAAARLAAAFNEVPLEKGGAERTLSQYLTEFAESPLWMRYSAEQLRSAIAVYGEGLGLTGKITPAEKVADPQKYPTLRVGEVMELFDVSRSSIYRWLDEGLLERAPLSEGRPKGTVLILTESVAKLLKRKQKP